MIAVTFFWGPSFGLFTMFLALVAVNLNPRWNPENLVLVDAVFTLLSLGSIWLIEKIRFIISSEKQQRRIQSDFLTMLAHEIRTPLTCIQTAASSLSVISKGELAAGRIHNQNLAVEEILAILDRCIEADKLGAGHIETKPVPIEISASVSEVVENSGAIDRIRINCPSRIELTCDAIILRRILSNLIENAIRYSPKGTPITLEVAPERRVSRKGIAIRCMNEISPSAVPDEARMFEKFYRGPETTASSGAGLGLWLVNEFVHSLSGVIRCEVNRHRILFYLWIPLVQG